MIYVPNLQAAIEWVEARILGESKIRISDEQPALELHEIEMFKGSKPETLTDLEACLEKRSWKAGETIFSRGEHGDELFLIRKGMVKVMGYIGHGTSMKHIATYGRGDFVGGLAFLDRYPRSNDAIAITDCEMYVLTMEKFSYLAEQHKRIAFVLLSKLARMLAIRLRHTNNELSILQDN